VFVDDQEISKEAAAEPLNLTPAVEHTIQIKSGGASPAVIEEFTVELEPGQEERRELKSGSGRGKSRGSRSRQPAASDDEDSDLDDDDLDAESEDADSRPRGGPVLGGAGMQARASSGSQSGAQPSASRPSSSQQGSFTAFTRPFARVFIDGKDTGKMTPIAPRSAIPLAPGPHQVTFVVDDQKFHFNITIDPGERENLVRTLDVR
jgi:hypothetical protein